MFQGHWESYSEFCVGTFWQDQLQVVWGLAEAVAVLGMASQDTVTVTLEYLWLMSMTVFSYYFSFFQNICIKVCKRLKIQNDPKLRKQEIIVSFNKYMSKYNFIHG